MFEVALDLNMHQIIIAGR